MGSVPWGEGTRLGTAGRGFEVSVGERAVQELLSTRLAWAGQFQPASVLCGLCSLSSVS